MRKPRLSLRTQHLTRDHNTYKWKMGFEPLPADRMPMVAPSPPQEAEPLFGLLKIILSLTATSCREESFFFYFWGFSCFLSNVDFIVFS